METSIYYPVSDEDLKLGKSIEVLMGTTFSLEG